jgi:hypothetical protein
LYSGNWCFIEWAENIPNLILIPIPLLPKGIARRQAFIRIKLNYYLYEYRTYGYSFSSDFERANKTLNIEWLSKYFKIEPKDELVLPTLRKKLSIKVE